MRLPANDHLPIGNLVACFNNTTATYKFYWLLSILEQVQQGKTLIAKKELFAGMIGHAWYTVNYFHVLFGKSDFLVDYIQAIGGLEEIPVTAPIDLIIDQLITSTKRETQALLFHSDKNVPHRFLSPWFSGAEKNQVYVRSNNPN